MRTDPKASGWLDFFLEFIGRLTIDSKETGVGRLRLLGSQKRLLAEVCEGLDRGVRHFVVLKARQLGVSTLSLAIDLFWLFVHPGMQASLVTDTEGNRDKFRIILERYMASLPKSHKVNVVKHNRNNLVLANGGVLDYLVAGTRRSGVLARGRANNFLHATECSSWGDQEGIASLLATLAEKHPDRFYLFESTARGFNLFWDIWRQAREDPFTQKAIFIGWWANEQYALERSDVLFSRYWDGELLPEEREKCEEVAERYGAELTPEQIAWYRWKSETRLADQALMDQEYPWTEDQAFVLTGPSFFSQKKLAGLIETLETMPPPFRGYRYQLSLNFAQIELEKVTTAHEAQLKIWEAPVEGAIYVMGCDPAYGRSALQDNHVISIWRCYADRLVQVAEFATCIPETYQVGWVMAHLAGLYLNIMVNLEISGPGMAIMQELRHLKQLFDAGVLKAERSGKAELENVLGNVRWYLYHRQDSPGPGFQFNWKTNLDNKQMILNQLRDSFSIGLLEPRSMGMADEMRTLVQEGSEICASGTNKDDRVFAAALAHRAWIDWVRSDLIASGSTFERLSKIELARETGDPANLVSIIVSDFFQEKSHERDSKSVPSYGVES